MQQFALAELILVFSYGALVTIWPRYGGWAIVFLLLLWLIHLVNGRITFEKNAIIYPLALVVITAAIGIWAAYDRHAAWEKFWIIIASVAVFIALVNQPKANLGVVAGLVGLMGVIIAFIFILNNDWTIQSSDFSVIDRAGDWIMVNRPSFGTIVVQPNIAGGLMAILLPITLGFGIGSWGKRNLIAALTSFGMAMAILAGLFMTSSRGGWVALMIGVSVWGLWRISGFGSVKIKRPQQKVFVLTLLIILIPLIWLIATYPGGLVEIANRLPGSPSGESRLDLAFNTSKLIEDYPFTGGGLRSFPGLYSQYIMVSPYFLYSYSHNFYLDVIFEQGLIGGCAILAVIIWGAWKLIKRKQDGSQDRLIEFLSEAILISTLVLLLHGLVDDPIYGEKGTPLLLLLPGLALMLVNLDQTALDLDEGHHQPKTSQGQSELNSRRIALPGIILIAIISFVFIFRNSLLSSWYANLGAVEMSRWELEGWPEDQWNDDPDVSPLESTKDLFLKALGIYANQRTAWHRLGLIAMQSRDFENAQKELQKAYEIDPDHRGIRKSLGYAYVWGNRLQRAEQLLNEISEAKSEMEVYVWWWGKNGRTDLSNQANEMASILEAINQ